MIYAPLGSKHLRKPFFDNRLPVAPRNSYDGDLKTLTMVTCQLLQRSARIFYTKKGSLCKQTIGRTIR